MSLYLLFQGFIFLFLPPGAAKIASLQVLPTALLGAPNRTRTSPSRTVPVWRRLTCATDHPYAGDRRPRPGPHPNLRRGFCRSRETPPRHSEATPRGRTRISRGGRCQSPSSWPTMWRRAAARLPAPPTPHPPRSPFPRCYRAGPRALPYVAPTHQRFRSAPAHPWARNENRLRQRSGLAVSPSTRPYSAQVGLSLLSPPEAPSGEAVQSPDKCWDRCRAPPASRSYRPSTPAAGD